MEKGLHAQKEITLEGVREGVLNADDGIRLSSTLALGKMGGKNDLSLLAETLQEDGNCLVQFAAATSITLIAGRLEKGDAQSPNREVDAFAVRYRIKDFPVMNALEAAAEFHAYAKGALAKAGEAAAASLQAKLEELGDWGGNFERVVTALAIHKKLPSAELPEVLALARQVDENHFESSKDTTELTRKVAKVYGKLLGKGVSEVDLQLSADVDSIREKIRDIPELEGFDADYYVSKWRKKLAEAKNLTPTGGNILSIRGTNTDQVYTLHENNVKSFFHTCGITEEQPLTQDELAIINNANRPEDPSNVRQIAVTVLWAMTHGGKKCSIDDQTISRFGECMEEAGITPDARAGGASSNIANNLPREQGMTVYSQDVHSSLEGKFGDNVRRLRIESGTHTSDNKINDDIDPNAPLRVGYVIEFKPGIDLEIPTESGETLQISRDRMDRHIFGAADKPDTPPSKPYFVTKVEQTGEGFAFQVPDDETVEKIGRTFPVIFLNGLQYLKTPEDEEIMRSQVQALRRGKAFLHCPLSSMTAGKMDYLNVIKNTGGEGVNSIGMNHTEVETVASEVKRVLNLEDMEVRFGGTPIDIFENAFAIARALNTRVYVHGEDFDVIIRENTNTGDLRNEVQGALYSKYAMVPKLVEGRSREGFEIYDNVKLEGLEDMVDIAIHAARNYGVDPDQFLKRGYTQTPMQGDWEGEWWAAIIPPKHIYQQENVIYPTGAGDCAEANDTVYGPHIAGLKQT
ncbi:MAG: hypothetical protein ABH851_01765 [Methanobacteriota archaeon]